jgi:glutathione S-transferase
MDDGGTLTENIAILNYLADHTGEKLYTPAAGSLQRYRLEEWLGFITTELHKSFSPLFQGASGDEAGKIKEKIGKRLAHTDEQIGGKPFLMGDRMSVADAYLFVILTWAKKMHLDTARFSNLTAFFARMAERRAVQRALKEEGLPLPA